MKAKAVHVGVRQLLQYVEKSPLQSAPGGACGGGHGVDADRFIDMFMDPGASTSDDALLAPGPRRIRV